MSQNRIRTSKRGRSFCACEPSFDWTGLRQYHENHVIFHNRVKNKRWLWAMITTSKRACGHMIGIQALVGFLLFWPARPSFSSLWQRSLVNLRFPSTQAVLRPDRELATVCTCGPKTTFWPLGLPSTGDC